MKRCSECGENYDDRVDFCFGDGSPLESIEAPAPKSVVATKPARPFLPGLEVPDAESFSAFDVPEPDGFAFPEPEAVGEAQPEPVAETPGPVSTQEAGVAEASQVQESGSLPVGFIEPPSQSVPAPPVAPSEPDDDFDDLGFPADFGTDDFSGDDFGFGDYTEPTMPAPSGKKPPIVFIAIGLGVLVLGMGAKILMGGGSDNDSNDQTTLAKRDTPEQEPAKPTDAAPGRDSAAPAPDLEAEIPDEGEGEAAFVPEPFEWISPKEPTPIPSVDPFEKRVPDVMSTPDPIQPDVAPAVAEVTSVDESPWGPVQAKANSLVRIYSKPSGAIVFVDGRQRGNTPAEVELSDGQHSIRVEKDGYFSEDRNLKVTKPSHLERFKLNARDQRVTVNCYGPDASKVYLNGAVVCAIPGSGTLAIGKHTFRVVTPDRFFKMDLVVKARPDGSPTPLRFTD